MNATTNTNPTYTIHGVNADNTIYDVNPEAYGLPPAPPMTATTEVAHATEDFARLVGERLGMELEYIGIFDCTRGQFIIRYEFHNRSNPQRVPALTVNSRTGQISMSRDNRHPTNIWRGYSSNFDGVDLIEGESIEDLAARVADVLADILTRRG